MIKLRKIGTNYWPSVDDSIYFDFSKKLSLTNTNGFPWVYGLSMAQNTTEFRKVLKKYDEANKKGNITWWIELDGRPIGIGRTREHPTTNLVESGAGNIGFGLVETERGKGYGEEAFVLLLQYLKDKGVKPILAGVLKSNYASKKIIEKNGGKILKIIENNNKTILEYTL